jgi:hypothetical protein
MRSVVRWTKLVSIQLLTASKSSSNNSDVSSDNDTGLAGSGEDNEIEDVVQIVPAKHTELIN